MTIGEMAGSKNVKPAITCVVIGLALVLGIGLVSCSGIASVGEIGANQAVADAAGGVVEDADLPEAETEPIGQLESSGKASPSQTREVFGSEYSRRLHSSGVASCMLAIARVKRLMSGRM